ncbi:dolichyl-phosphate-mannose-protein mannosyltransferase [Halococcus morrhuae DSM 1307]|uniref:Dolichyl-phosphate-mannose-protein mannosyltransferase n=1 Tax=Halococcus morrhuae DSM 1307 TaxID=931277 RepID=M0M5Z6_HALMO|nr:flippase activity-associated protein Agl23 [Halococcus morrhuae]EMA39805.1 dolichyl-phosphate-mannose-protein mannosyltransferase [Halococcus morrhuae DSM 1307]
MASTDGSAGRGRRVTTAVVAIALFALVARLLLLGDRIAHWDEARVAYWILDYADTGVFEYQPIIHGPFLQQVNRVVFELFGANDFTMRLVVAALGAALPLAALLFRKRLSDVETVAFALFLAVDPVLLYYSRFMRSDLPLAAFMLFALGFFLRALDSRRPRYVHAGIVALALAFTTKENVLVYLVTWLGALVLLVDRRLLVDHRPFADRDLSFDLQAARERIGAFGTTLRTWVPHLLLAVVEFLVIVVYFYAPRTNGSTPGFDTLLSDPTALPAVIGEATLGSWNAFISQWISGDSQSHAYLPYLGDLVETLVVGSGALVVLAAIGFLADRYADDGPRDLVAFAFYCGFVSVLGYPIITDIMAPWAAVHAVVFLMLPAAVGAGVLYTRARTALSHDDRPGVAAALVIVLLVVGQVGYIGVQNVYLDDQSASNALVQYAQPADDLRPTIEEMAAVSANNRGTDVLLYGDHLVADSPGSRAPGCSDWFNILPLPWYTEAHDMNVSCATEPSGFEQRVNESSPPVVIGLTTDSEFLAANLEGYDERAYVLRTQDTAKTNTTFFLDESRLPKVTTEQSNP